MGGGKSVNPLTIAVSIVGLLIVLGVVYFFTLGRSPTKAPEEESPIVSTPPPATRQ